MNIKDYVSKQASEWIGGIKKFLSFPYGPEDTPQEDYQLINKQYADTGIASLSVSISNLFSSVSASLGAISTFLTNEVIWSSTCNRLVVSTAADPTPTQDDIWIDMARVPSIVSTTTDYTLLSTDLVVLCNASGGAFSVVLGSAPVHAFRNYYFKKIDSSANAITINPNGNETIDSNLVHYLVGQNETLHIASDAVNWYHINAHPLTHITASSVTLSAGSVGAGMSVADFTSIDTNIVSITESANPPAFNLWFTFSNIKKADYVFFRGNYWGSTTHYVYCEIYNNTTSAWDKLGQLLTTALTDQKQNYMYYIPNANDDYISSGTVLVRLHHPTSGVATHRLIMNYMALIVRS